MIYNIKKSCSPELLNKFQNWATHKELEYKLVELNGNKHIVTSSSSTLNLSTFENYDSFISEYINTGNEFQLSSRKFQSENTVITLSKDVVFGDNKTIMMAGPCAIESEKQVMSTAEFLVKNFDIKIFRAGAFKPRTSPYSFQGMEKEGLRLLEKVRNEFGIKIITEVKDEGHLNEVADVSDIIQIGTKSMYLFNMLAHCGKIKKPILLKRGFMATLKEFLQAADFIIANGNPNVILCERGIRTFEPMTRFSLDICSAALLKEISHLPIVLDPSHSMGRSNQVPLVAQAAAALEIDGLLVETHPNPSEAKSDREQALSFEQFTIMMKKINSICKSVNRKLI